LLCKGLTHFVVHASTPPFTTNESTGDSNTEMYMKWNSNRKLDFVNCVQNDNTGILPDVLTDLENRGTRAEILQDNIDETVNKIVNTFC
jgi:hypothetical protein